MQGRESSFAYDPVPEHIRSALDLLPNLVCVARSAETAGYLNSAWRDYAGVRPDETAGKSWMHWVHPDDRFHVLMQWKQFRRDNTPFEVECRLRHVSGAYRWFLTQAQPRRDENGGASYRICICTDIHERRLREIDLEQKARIRADMLDVGVDCIMMITPDGNLAHVNRSACLALGLSEGSGLGLPWLDLLPQEIREAGSKALEVARNGQSAHFPGLSQRRGHNPWHWDTMLHPVKNDHGETTAILCVSRDVTLEREAEERLRLSRERLELATRAGKLGCFDYLPEAGTLDLDARCRELFGVSPNAPVSYDGTFLGGIHPEDRAQAEAAVKAALDPAGDGSFDVEIRTIGIEDRVERILLAKGLASFKDGVALRLIGTLQDVTADRGARRKLLETEERFRLAVRATNDAIWDFDLQRDHILWNEALERRYGHKLDAIEPSARWWLQHVHPEDRDRVRRHIRDFLKSSDIDWTAEYRFARADGHYVDVYDRGYVIRDASGRATRMIGSLLDQTDRKAFERKLQALNQALETSVTERTAELNRLWESSPDLLVVIAFDGTIQRVNPAWKVILGYEPADVIGRHATEFLMPEDVPLGERALEDTKVRQLEIFEARHRHRDGSMRWVSWVAAPMEREIYATGRHITDAKEAEAALRQTEEALRQSQKVEAIGKLTGGVAHDFNNLLTVIRGSIDLLRRPNLTAERRERYLEAISTTTDRAVNLTSQLLAFARRSSLKPETLDVGASVLALREMIGTLSGSGISVEIAASREACYAHLDPSQFDTAIINMAVNARDAMDRDGCLKIDVRPVSEIPALRAHAAVKGEFVAVSISDTGTGIPDDSMDQIFEPFFTTKGVGKGTGLGLSQVIGFAKQSGGEVLVESHLGAGSTFTLYLPRVAPAADHGDVSLRERAAPLKLDRILVVEDNSEVGTFATRALAELGYSVVLVPNGEQALATLAAGAFDAVFSDVVMPGLSGIELGKEIRRRHPGLPVLLTSGYSGVLAEEGAHGFELLHKPYSISDLAQSLERVIRKAEVWA